MKEIKDKDILEAFKLGDKDPENKLFHGVIRKDGRITVVFEKKLDQGYSGFPDRASFDFSNLNSDQRTYLESRGYSLEK